MKRELRGITYGKSYTFNDFTIYDSDIDAVLEDAMAFVPGPERAEVAKTIASNIEAIDTIGGKEYIVFNDGYWDMVADLQDDFGSDDEEGEYEDDLDLCEECEDEDEDEDLDEDEDFDDEDLPDEDED